MGIKGCMCSKFKIFFSIAKWTTILPMESYGITTNHCSTGCKFRIWKYRFWLSFLYLLSLTLYEVWLLHLHNTRECEEKEFFKFTKLFVSIFHFGEIHCILILNSIYSYRLSNLFERLSVIPSNLCDYDNIYKKIFLLLLFEANFIIGGVIAWVAAIFLDHPICTVLDCALPNILQNITNLFQFAQAIIVVLLCLLITSKFDNLAEATKEYLELVTHSERNNQSKTDMTKKTTNRLEDLHQQMCEICSCLAEMNQCMGLQLLCTLCVLLMYLIHFTFYTLTIRKHNLRVFIQIHILTNLFCSIVLLIIFTTIGHAIKAKGRKPLELLQNAKLFQLSFYHQQQIQTLLQQWMSMEPTYLSAIVVQLGPWLLGPITGNVITYLIVFLQQDK